VSAWLLASGVGAPDREFPSTADLAAWIHALRCERPHRPEIKLVTAILARDALPGGACVSVYILDGSHERGRLLGYAMCLSQPDPPTHRDHCYVASPARHLMDAIDLVRDGLERKVAA
jgi:hypothetical protein